MESDDKRLAEAAMLAGEIMLVSGAEIARIEEMCIRDSSKIGNVKRVCQDKLFACECV